ncbi:uncharacterized protein PFL1_00655 [Pseudozyma flocculosa PF-1]|uniref:uncharacterized protein n=1 Tax=Pseudozyma flocculosa PF-1 TaxID=1277687 RepID=UPI0004560546|nr:uncharacterized protein PFL1_00655 [Pseudozyma flocculosa PF-1]EPQ32460.1 hypothetical protein PFL1_00655 [Pseudozyma flocculosa PF-1]
MLPQIDDADFPVWFRAMAYRSSADRDASETQCPGAMHCVAPLVAQARFESICDQMFEQSHSRDLFSVVEHLAERAFQHSSQGQEKDRREENQERLASAFAAPYRGSAHHRFDDAIANYYIPRYRPGYTYGRVVPIVQSSGTGKSRMVHELRHLWPTLILTLRSKADEAESGYPVAEHSTVDFFQQSFAAFSSPDLAFIAFFVAWFTEVDAVLKSPSTPPPRSMDKVLGAWSLHREAGDARPGTREALFAQVCKQANLLRESEADFQQPVPVIGRADHLRRIMMRLLKPSMDRLEQTIGASAPVQEKRSQLDRAGSTRPVVMYVAIDDFALLDSAHTPRGPLPSSSLRSCLALMSEMHGNEHFQFWFLLLDAGSAVFEVFPAHDEGPSSRARCPHHFPIWVDLGFDVLVDEAPPVLAAIQALEIARLRFYGRPLWAACRDTSVLEVAVTKLAPPRDEAGLTAIRTAAADLTSPRTAAAVLSQRCAIDLVPLRCDSAGNHLARELVSRHMRVLGDLRRDGVCVTASASEPMLALAAGYILQRDRNAWKTVLRTLLERFLSLGRELDLRGSHGEFLGRLLLTLARDAAQPIHPDLLAREMTHVEPIRLDVFLASLVAEPVLTGSVATELRGKAESAWLNFTHMTVLDDVVDGVSQGYLWLCWKRGVAIQFSRRQGGIVGLLPVFLGGRIALESSVEDETDLWRHMSYVGWQVTHRRSAQTLARHLHGPPIIVAPPTSADWGTSGGTSSYEVPGEAVSAHMTILMDLGRRGSNLSPSPGAPATIVYSGCEQRYGIAHSTTILHLRGCGSSTYACLDRLGVTDEFQAIADRIADAELTVVSTVMLPFEQTIRPESWPPPCVATRERGDGEGEGEDDNTRDAVLDHRRSEDDCDLVDAPRRRRRRCEEPET